MGVSFLLLDIVSVGCNRVGVVGLSADEIPCIQCYTLLVACYMTR